MREGRLVERRASSSVSAASGAARDSVRRMGSRSRVSMRSSATCGEEGKDGKGQFVPERKNETERRRLTCPV